MGSSSSSTQAVKQPPAPEPEPEPEPKEPLKPNAPPHSRDGGYRPTAETLKKYGVREDDVRDGLGCLPGDLDITQGHESWVGLRWSIHKLSNQAAESIPLCAIIFVVNELVTASQMHYWRPFAWSIAWIAVTVLVSGVGWLANRKKDVFLMIMFVVLQLLFSAINLQHLNMTHSAAVRSCLTPQIEFRHCDNPALKHCIQTSQTVNFQGTCTTAELESVTPPCHAPGREQCQTFDHMDIVFWMNQVINFFTYAEPCFWVSVLLLRLEIVHQQECEEIREEKPTMGVIPEVTKGEKPNGGTTMYRKLALRGHHDDETVAEPLPTEAKDQPFVWAGALTMIVAAVMTLSFTIYLHATR